MRQRRTLQNIPVRATLISAAYLAAGVDRKLYRGGGAVFTLSSVQLNQFTIRSGIMFITTPQEMLQKHYHQ